MDFVLYIPVFCAVSMIILWILRCRIEEDHDAPIFILGHVRGIGGLRTPMIPPLINVFDRRNPVLTAAGDGGGEGIAVVYKRPTGGENCAICLSGDEHERVDDSDDGGDGVGDDHDLVGDDVDDEESNRWVALSRCDHCFHSDCIHAWLRNHRTCPLCREPHRLVM